MTDNPIDRLEREIRCTKTGRAEIAGGVARVYYADLPSTANEGSLLFVFDGRKVGEAAGTGTGVPVYFSNGAWRVFSTDAEVTV